jgi:hypothetical protein
MLDDLQNQVGPEETHTRSFKLPPIQDGADLLAGTPEIPPEVIHGMLHQGSKAVLGGGSKTCKTWCLLDLGVSVATGLPWWGFETTKGRVLYVNFEIQAAFFQQRLKALADEKGLSLEKGDFSHLCLRGVCAGTSIEEFGSALLEHISGQHFALIIIDPIYKMLGEKDENKTGDITHLVNHLERIAAESGAAVMIGAHFSKGNQAEKESIDRISGSGVWAGDPDVILTLTKHKQEDVFVVQPVLRNVAPIKEFCVRWKYPLMVLEPSCDPKDLKGRKSSKKQGNLPTEAELMSLFPKEWPQESPREGLLSTKQLQDALSSDGYDKTEATNLRDQFEKMEKLAVLRGGPHGEILAGLPAAVEAYKKWREGNACLEKAKRPRKAAPKYDGS